MWKIWSVLSLPKKNPFKSCLSICRTLCVCQAILLITSTGMRNIQASFEVGLMQLELCQIWTKISSKIQYNLAISTAWKEGFVGQIGPGKFLWHILCTGCGWKISGKSVIFHTLPWIHAQFCENKISENFYPRIPYPKHGTVGNGVAYKHLQKWKFLWKFEFLFLSHVHVG